jgi:hypothetical protein
VGLQSPVQNVASMQSEPKTITFNATPADEAQHRSARAGGRIAWYLIGIPSLLCLGVAASYNIWWAMSLGTSILETLMLCAISLTLTAFVGGLPTAKVLLATTYPGAARQADSIWFGALWLSAFSAVYFVATRDWALPQAAGAGSQIAWISAGYLDDRQTRALASLLLAFAALTGGSLGLRLAVLASAESWRLGTGQASWAPVRPAPTAAATAPAAFEASEITSPEAFFDLWRRNRLRPASGFHVNATAAYEDYRAAARVAGLEPVSLTRWGGWIGDMVRDSQGSILKSKIGGYKVYQGVVLIGSPEDQNSRDETVTSDSPRGRAPLISAPGKG